MRLEALTDKYGLTMDMHDLAEVLKTSRIQVLKRISKREIDFTYKLGTSRTSKRLADTEDVWGYLNKQKSSSQDSSHQDEYNVLTKTSLNAR